MASDIHVPWKIEGASKIRMDEATYAEESEENMGYCVKCHQSQSQVEPDAEIYKCESCGEPAVYGLQQLMLYQWIDLEDGVDE